MSSTPRHGRGGAREGAGRPPLPKGGRTALRLLPGQLEEIDAYARAQGVGQGEAIRRLLVAGLRAVSESQQ